MWTRSRCPPPRSDPAAVRGPASAARAATAVRGRRPHPLLAVLPALAALLLAVLVAAEWAPLLALDAGVSQAARGVVTAHPGLGEAGRVVEAVTQPVWWWVPALVATLVALRRGSRRTAFAVAAAIVCAGLMSPLLKAVVGRARPALDPALTTAEGGSYPSGHVLAATVVGGCAALVLDRRVRGRGRRPLVWAVLAVVVLVVAADRVLVGAHWPSDTVGSVLLGSAVLVVVARALDGPPQRDG